MSNLVDDGNNAGAAAAPAATAAVTPSDAETTCCDGREQASDQTATFMARVIPWPKDGELGYCNLHWTVPNKNGMRGHAYTNIEDFMRMARWGTTSPGAVRDIYFCLSSQTTTGNVINGKVKALRNGGNVHRLKALWLDVDVKPDKGYPTTEAALAALKKFINDAKLPPPTALVLSGSGGMHVYWISDRPLTKDEWQPYADGLEALATHHGFKRDPGLTTDCVRILRVPETWNYKSTPPKGVRLATLAVTDVNFEQVLGHIRAISTAVTGPVTKLADLCYNPTIFPARTLPEGTESLAAGIHTRRDVPLDYTGIFAGCSHFQRTFKTHGRDSGQGLWMLDVLASTFLQEGRPIAHTLSKGYKTYTKEETDAMFDRKVTERVEKGLGWPSCGAFESAGCEECAGCPFKGEIRSPLNLAARVAPPATDFPDSTRSAGPKSAAWNAAELKLSFANVPHRRWLYGTYLIRGEITVLAAPGGAGKTALATGLAVEIATNTELLGEKIYQARDLKVLFINSEDGTTEIERRVFAFCKAHANKIPVQSPDRLFVAGANNAQVQRLSLLKTTDRNVSTLDMGGFEALEAALEALRPDLLILDPLVVFCGGGNMNDNAIMALVIRELKRLATKFNCAVLIVHHTRKGIDDGNAEAISGASAIVNLARRAIMPVPMTHKEAEQFCVPPSERFRYFKLVDAKSNLAPRSTDSPWYRLHSVELPNPEPPAYPHGDNVQAVERVNLSLLQTTIVTSNDQKIRDAILDLISRGKAIDGQSYPYSPSAAGASKERALLDDAMATVQSATAPRQWLPDDLKAAIKGAIKKMKAEGLIVEKEMKELVSAPGRFRRGRGLTVVRPTAQAKASAGDRTAASNGTAPGGGQLVNPRSIE